MKRIFYLILFIGCAGVLTAQEQTQNKPLSMEEKLVRLAIINNPDMEILNNNKDIALYNMRKHRWSWVNQVTLSGNLNEFTIDQNAAGDAAQPAFYPRYNISLTLPLGILGSRPNEVKMAREEFDNTEVELRKKQIEIRKQVLSLYENYLLYQKLILIQNQKTEDEYAYFKSIENKFTNQKAGIEEFKNASNTYNMELERKYTLSYEQKVVKLGLESLIGMSLEEAEKYTFPVEAEEEK